MSASTAAIDAGENETALEWLEQGRCLVWNQIQQLCTPVISMLIIHPSPIASGMSQEASGSRQTEPVLFAKKTMRQMITAQAENKRHAELAKEWNQLLNEIRALPDFSDFLRPPAASTLLEGLPCDGPVVIFNIHKVRCDALALISGADEPLHIPLPTFSHKQAVELRDRLRGYLKKQSVRVRETERAGRPFEQPKKGTHESTIHMVLREIWEHVVKPVLDATYCEFCRRLRIRTDHGAGGVPLGPLPSFLSMLLASMLQRGVAPGPVCQTSSSPRIHPRLAP